MAKVRKTVDQFTDLLKNIWPNERDIVVRPERLKYVRKLVKPKGCVFCEASKSKSRKKSLVLYKDDLVMVVINKYPYNNGHLLVMPVDHIAHVEELPEDTFMRLNSVIRECVKILKKVYRCQALNVGANLGAAAGAGIPDHLHYHIIPRWMGDTNFFPLIAQTKLVIESNDSTYDRLKEDFKKLEKKT